MDEHLRTHDNILTKCHYCVYTAVADDRQNLLSTHYNSHFKIRPYKCSFCEDRFYKVHHVRNHEETSHEIIENKHKCKLCSFQHYSGRALAQHKLTKH
jgi:hypothetical protein